MVAGWIEHSYVTTPGLVKVYSNVPPWEKFCEVNFDGPLSLVTLWSTLVVELNHLIVVPTSSPSAIGRHDLRGCGNRR